MIRRRGSPNRAPSSLPAAIRTDNGVPFATGGTFRFQRRLLCLANSLTHHRIGLKETDDAIWAIYFNTVLLAKLDERD